MYILIRSLQFSLCFEYTLCFALQMGVYFLCSILAVDIFIIVFALFVGLLMGFSAYKIGLRFLGCYNNVS
jgi:hypothetical protein